jgi:hypothetical protein
MAVVAILVSLLTPSLSHIRESARQVVCRSNVRQIGIGIQLHADVDKDRVPPCVNADLGGPAPSHPWNTVELRIEGTPDLWDGLGLLYVEDILPAPKLYYCPSHKGENPFVRYAEQWAGRENGMIRGNFQYRGGCPSSGNRGPQAPLLETTVLGLMRPRAALVADGMRTQSDFNHVVGANVLRADLSVSWREDRGLLDDLPKEGEEPGLPQFQNAWRSLDE